MNSGFSISDIITAIQLKTISRIVLFSILIFSACGKKAEQTKAKVSDLTESVYASGRIKALDQYSIFPNVNGTIKKVYVEAGDSVGANQVLFEMDDLTSELSTENAKLALDLSEENARKGSEKLKELEIGLKLSADKFELDADLYKKQKSLWAQGVGTESELDQRKLALDNSKYNVQTAKSKLQQLKTVLQNELNRSRNNFKISRKQKNDFVIKSLFKGHVFDVLKKEGELASTQTPLAILGKGDQFLIELEVDQTDIVWIKPGQKVYLGMDSYKGKVFEAKISKIYPIMDERSRTFKVEAEFIALPPSLFPNLTAEANIIILEKKNALTIPLSYLVEGKYVMLGKEEKQEVKLGLRDYQKVEVLSGIDSTTVLYKPK